MFTTAAIGAYMAHKNKSGGGDDIPDEEIERILRWELKQNVSTLLKLKICKTDEDVARATKIFGQDIEHNDDITNVGNEYDNDDEIIAVGAFDVSLNVAKKWLTKKREKLAKKKFRMKWKNHRHQNLADKMNLNNYVEEADQNSKDNDDGDKEGDRNVGDDDNDVEGLSLTDIIVVAITNKRIVMMDYIIDNNKQIDDDEEVNNDEKNSDIDKDQKINIDDDENDTKKSDKRKKYIFRKSGDEKARNDADDDGASSKPKKSSILKKSGRPTTILMDTTKEHCIIRKDKHGIASQMYQVMDVHDDNNIIKLKTFNYDMMNQNSNWVSSADETAALLAAYYSNMDKDVVQHFDQLIKEQENKS